MAVKENTEIFSFCDEFEKTILTLCKNILFNAIWISPPIEQTKYPSEQKVFKPKI